MIKSSQHCQNCKLCSRLSNSVYPAGFCKHFKAQEAPLQNSPVQAVSGVSNHAITKPQAVDISYVMMASSVYTEDAIISGPSAGFHSATAATATSSGGAAAVPAVSEWLSREDSIVSSF